MKVVEIEPTFEQEKIFINNDESSWISFRKLRVENDCGLTMDDFEELWQHKPSDKLQVKYNDVLVNCPRYSTSYLQPYKFSGLNHEANMNMPERIKKLFEYCKTNLNPSLNQSLVNWYEPNGSIGKHSDDTRQLMPNSEIFSFTFGPAVRTFRLEPKFNNLENKIYHIKVEHNTLIIMGGRCQHTHMHSVPKVFNDNNRRLNVTFRCFKE